jgi:hypothetical protein
MKNLRQTLFVICAILISSGAFAQKISVKAGLNLANMTAKDDSKTYSSDYKTLAGFQVGATVEFPVSEKFGIETGLLFSTKGFKSDVASTKVTFATSYLDIPINAKVYFGSGTTKVYGAFGPYIGIGIGGKVKSETSFGGATIKTDKNIEFGTDKAKSDLKRVDFGVALGLGLEFNALQVGVSYGLGLANLAVDTSGGTKVKNKVFSVTVAYRFGGDKK